MPKSIKALTRLQCEKARYQPEGPNNLYDGQGLYLALLSTGSKTWRHKYRSPITSKDNQIGYGPFPEVSLAEARERHLATRIVLRDGRDPQMERHQQRIQEKVDLSSSFEAVALEWYGVKKTGWTTRHAFNVLSRLKNDVFPAFGNMHVGEIDSPTVLKVLRAIEDRNAPDIARRVSQYCYQIFHYAIGVGKPIKANPAHGLTSILRPYIKGHFARIEIRDIPKFLAALDNDGASRAPTWIATQLLMLTLVRTGALIEAKWAEVDFHNMDWVIPSERVKVKGRPDFIVPLSHQAVALLKQLNEITGWSTYLFPHNSNARQNMSNATILNAISRAGYAGQMTGHGFRSLGADTLHALLGHNKKHVDKCLGHQEKSKISAAYFRDPLLEPRRRLMQAWADFIDFCRSVKIEEKRGVEKLMRLYANQSANHKMPQARSCRKFRLTVKVM